MWICLNNAFFSVVQDDRIPENFLVRSRRKNHLEIHFPNEKIIISDMNKPRKEEKNGKVIFGDFPDYKYRVSVEKSIVIQKIAEYMSKIDYRNFKGSTGNIDKELAQLYGGFWYEHFNYQR